MVDVEEVVDDKMDDERGCVARMKREVRQDGSRVQAFVREGTL